MGMIGGIWGSPRLWFIKTMAQVGARYGKTGQQKFERRVEVHQYC
jgi:hypothetical protein